MIVTTTMTMTTIAAHANQHQNPVRTNFFSHKNAHMNMYAYVVCTNMIC